MKARPVVPTDLGEEDVVDVGPVAEIDYALPIVEGGKFDPSRHGPGPTGGPVARIHPLAAGVVGVRIARVEGKGSAELAGYPLGFKGHVLEGGVVDGLGFPELQFL